MSQCKFMQASQVRGAFLLQRRLWIKFLNNVWCFVFSWQEVIEVIDEFIEVLLETCWACCGSCSGGVLGLHGVFSPRNSCIYSFEGGMNYNFQRSNGWGGRRKVEFRVRNSDVPNFVTFWSFLAEVGFRTNTLKLRLDFDPTLSRGNLCEGVIQTCQTVVILYYAPPDYL